MYTNVKLGLGTFVTQPTLGPRFSFVQLRVMNDFHPLRQDTPYFPAHSNVRFTPSSEPDDSPQTSVLQQSKGCIHSGRRMRV